MAFNLAEFNKTAFNARAELFRYLIVEGIEAVTSSVGSSMDIYPTAYGNERVNIAEMGGDQTYFLDVEGLETVTEAVEDAELTAILIADMAETVTAQTYLSAENNLSAAFKEIVTEDTALGADIYLVASFNETISEDTALGANFYTDAEGYELISESASLISIETKTAVLTLTLRPGQRLIIDSETYTVLLDGENALDTHSGDWIDELTRETTDIMITAASGATNLSASILYTERYL